MLVWALGGLLILSFLFMIGMMLHILFLRDKIRAFERIPQRVAHRLPTPDIDVLRENKRLSIMIPRLEKESKFWKQEAERWMPRYDRDEFECCITQEEAEGWVK